MLPEKLAFVDIETTGTASSFDRIIEIGILRIEHNKLVSTFKSLINPQTYLSPFIQQMTGIQTHELENAPTFRQVKDEILEHLQDAVFVAHNVRFDYGFLKNEFKRQQTSFSAKHFCTVKLSRYLFPRYKKHNLDALIERFGFECKNRHRAFDDAKVLWDFYQNLQKTVKKEKLLAAVDKALKKPSVPILVNVQVIESLPETSGVYIFYDSNNTPLYIGKSVNIKERVMSHFSSDHASAREMAICQQVAHVDYIETAGELGALLRESALIKKLNPIYNRKLRIKRKLLVLKKTVQDNGYQTVALTICNSIDPSEIDSIVGVYKSKKQAKEFMLSVAKKYKLCQKLLGIDSSKSYCFSFHLGICLGACLSEEPPKTYNMRFSIAFSASSFKKWPFGGPILVEDTKREDQKEAFLVDKWCLLGSVKSDDLDAVNYSQKDIEFDVDTYTILHRFLASGKNNQAIKVISPHIASQFS